MRPWLAILLLIGFISIAVFGAFAMGHSDSNHSSCIAETASGTDCPKDGNLLASAAFYLKAFVSFSTAVFASAAGAASLFFIFAFALIAVLSADKFRLAPAFASQRFRSAENISEHKTRLHSLLALFEKRDPNLY